MCISVCHPLSFQSDAFISQDLSACPYCTLNQPDGWRLWRLRFTSNGCLPTDRACGLFVIDPDFCYLRKRMLLPDRPAICNWLLSMRKIVSELLWKSVSTQRLSQIIWRINSVQHQETRLQSPIVSIHSVFVTVILLAQEVFTRTWTFLFCHIHKYAIVDLWRVLFYQTLGCCICKCVLMQICDDCKIYGHWDFWFTICFMAFSCDYAIVEDESEEFRGKWNAVGVVNL